MKIAIDMSFTQPANGVKTNGGGEAALELFKEIKKKDVEILCFWNSKREYSEKLAKECDYQTIEAVSYDDLGQLSEIINNCNPDVVVFPVCSLEYKQVKINRNIRIVSIIHDLSIIYNDQLYKYEKRIGYSAKTYVKYFVKRILFRSVLEKRHYKEHFQLFHLSDYQKIFTVSNYSKYSLCWYFGIDLKSEVEVFYSSNENQEVNEEKLCELFDHWELKRNHFFLLVSGSRPHKNNYFAIKTIDKMYGKRMIDKSFKTVVTGVNKEHADYYSRHIVHKGQFVFLDFIDIQVLEGLYREEYALIYPSLYEGFGFPAVYAMKYGKNVVATSWTSLPEVCQNVAFYFDPIKEETLAIAIMDCLNTPRKANDIIRRYAEIHNRQKEDKRKLVDEIIKFASNKDGLR